MNLNHLKFYIGCSCYLGDSKLHFTIESVDTDSNMVMIKNVTLWQDVSIVKPILRKFESLSRHEVEQLNKLWPNERVNRTTFESIQLDAEIIGYLTSLHVDVFGWIDKGLAVDAEHT